MMRAVSRGASFVREAPTHRVGLAPPPRTICLAALALATLTACGSNPKPEPRIITRTVEVPVSVPCAVSVTEPTFPDTDEALAGAADIFEAAKLVMAGRLMRMAALGEYRAAVKGCAKP